ncbi:MAG: family 16 glycosylhydrolase [Bacteroidales bacterium]|nr:family 16 glycosylhydrolase [Bacteroidales bacterium]MCF8391949.1 family 16 glycosylhydrolase [Bacteroidales bacterium]
MAGLKFALGLIPGTAKVEGADDKLRKDYSEYNEYEKSDELKHYTELENEVNSSDFLSRKKALLALKYKGSEEFIKEKEYQTVGKSKPIKNYFKIKESRQLTEYTNFKNSDGLKTFQELEKFVNSEAFIKAKSELSPKEFKATEDAAKEKKYLSAKGSSQFKNNFKFENSTPYKEYLRVDGSEELKKYEDLKEYVGSEKFRKQKEYLLLPGKKKYELSEEFKKETEYTKLKKSDKVIWYQKLKKKYPFTEIEKWDLAFEENFESGKFDSKIWLTRYLNGDKIMNKPYVQHDDIHAFTDGKNISVSSGKLQITTKKEEAKALSWSPVFGFAEREYAYTSDMISTAKSFSQKEGKFIAKVKLGNSGVTQAFSLMTDMNLPHVDVFKYENNKLFAGNFWKNDGKNGISKSVGKTGGGRYTNDFHIFSLEWSEGKMVWKINGLEFKVQTEGLPQSEMHLCFNASLKETAKNKNFPSTMEIDWVRVYKKK